MINKIIIFFSFISLTLCQLINYNLELIHLIPFENAANNYGVSDVWGYTDETGKEYAIVGYMDGTSIYNITNSTPFEVANIIGPSTGDYYFHRDYKTFSNHLYIVNEILSYNANALLCTCDKNHDQNIDLLDIILLINSII